MQIATGIVVYLMIWWVVFFIVLPIGLTIPKRVQIGCEPSAPKKSRIGMKIGMTSLISLGVFIIYCFAVHFKIFSFREYVQTKGEYIFRTEHK